ncbi:MAG TPA: four helix bundle protein [Vicinamibacteria bacterium]
MAQLNPARTALTDAERMDVYRVALEFLGLSGSLLRSRGLGGLRDQLDRAAASIVLNIAEGIGRSTPADKARFFAIARGSALECATVVDVARIRGLVDVVIGDAARSLLLRVIQMLSKLLTRHRR